jgi:hypothetical protein
MNEKYILAEFSLKKLNPQFFCILKEFDSLKEAEDFRWENDNYYQKPWRFCTLPISSCIASKSIKVQNNCIF